jgi:cold shock CspA family protein
MSAQILATGKITAMSVSTENGNAKVKMYDAARGWGFLKADEGFDCFLHSTVLRECCGVDSLSPGDRITIVEFVEAERGPKATKVALADQQ